MDGMLEVITFLLLVMTMGIWWGVWRLMAIETNLRHISKDRFFEEVDDPR